ncbi:ACT domain-containing protein [Streptomonospora sp. S1-112]|uniref:ACT domain-containing protein n=1 Tax=Streptomonospora mangrovi TaxID=2883123 RepID=A0A9X3NNT2_9ACTN|nr:ACT domain-containing protein [Streptomonospora mangrovi]MDA0565563.1 ACT domain-containing protein [Streptomonospora mangrovi]
MSAPERDLARLLAGLDPHPHPGEYVFASCARVPEGLAAVVTVAEPEGWTVVCERAEAERTGLISSFPCAWITLRVHSALEAVGLTAAVAGALAGEGIACNVVAGFHHDHLFVPYAQGERAVALLRALAASG